MLNYRIIAVFFTFALLGHLPTAQATNDVEVAPPSADETLIYVMRERRFTGGGGNYWVAINDQTVDRLENGRYALIRAKAGLITLNLATAGIVLAPTALDDRPGQTVYLKWGVGDEELREVSEAEGLEFTRNRGASQEPTAALPNKEEIQILANPSRMGFDLTRVASQKIEPDAEHAVITFFRRTDGADQELGIWSDQGFVSTLGIKEGVRLRVRAGEGLFLVGNAGTSILKTEFLAGKEYFARLEYGKGTGKVRLKPVASKQAKKLKKWLREVTWVEPDTQAVTARVRDRGDIVKAFMLAEVQNSDSRRSRLLQLGNEHAVDSAALQKHKVEGLIAGRYDAQIAMLKSASAGDGSDISGTYKSRITGGGKGLFGKTGTRVVLKQNGNKVSGKFSGKRKGDIWGEVEGSELKFEWSTSGGYAGRGEWKLGGETTELQGSWSGGKATRAEFSGDWKLERIE